MADVFHPVRQSRRIAFTLAEVLITLGIIGVVAAIVMPSLIQNYKRKVYSTRLKETYSILSQAVKLSEIDNGPSSTWERHYTDNYTDGEYDDNKNTMHCYNFFMKYLAPYLKSDASEKNLTSRTYRLSNGVTIFMHNGHNMDLYVYVDKPNHHGADLHYFAVKSTGGLQVGYGAGNNREDLKRLCKSSYSNGAYGVNSNWPYCTCLLLHDNWEFKDDFPLKL